LQDASTQILFEYIIQPKAVKSDLTEILNGALKVSITSLPQPVPPVRLQVKLPVSESPEQKPPDKRIVQALSRLMLYRMQERAREEVRDGHIDSASQHLQTLASSLISQGERGLAQTILLEVDHLQKHSALTSEGSKKMNYGTRALLNAPPKKE
jgi:Ca-activated chloride channel family protein